MVLFIWATGLSIFPVTKFLPGTVRGSGNDRFPLAPPDYPDRAMINRQKHHDPFRKLSLQICGKQNSFIITHAGILVTSV